MKIKIEGDREPEWLRKPIQKIKKRYITGILVFYAIMTLAAVTSLLDWNLSFGYMFIISVFSFAIVKSIIKSNKSKILKWKREEYFSRQSSLDPLVKRAIIRGIINEQMNEEEAELAKGLNAEISIDKESAKIIMLLGKKKRNIKA